MTHIKRDPIMRPYFTRIICVILYITILYRKTIGVYLETN